jgi:hypothetical protein
MMKFSGWFDWLKKSELVELKQVDCSQDPVRPELDIKFRTSYGRKIYGLKHNGEIKAVMCFGFVNEIPTTVEELDLLSKDAYLQATHRAGIQGSIAIAYTVWSLKKGGGKMIVDEVYKMIKKSNHLNRLITLSPLTQMAERFHLKNGARLIQKNETSQNFEYIVSK